MDTEFNNLLFIIQEFLMRKSKICFTGLGGLGKKVLKPRFSPKLKIYID